MVKDRTLEGFVPWPDEYVKKYKSEGYWESFAFGEVLSRWVELHGNRPALVYQGKEITYRQMDEYATRLAYYMVRRGVKTYDRVIMQLFNTPELVYMIYACMKIGTIPISCLPTHRWAEISFLAKETEARIHIIPAGHVKDFDYEAFADEVRKATPSLEFILTLGKPEFTNMVSINDILTSDIDLNVARTRLARYRPDPMQPAFFQLSGGTTDVPKIIPRTHNDYYYNCKCSAIATNLNENTRLLIAMPLMHNLPLVGGLLAVHSRGGAAVITPSFAPEALLQAIADNAANTMVTVPIVMHRLLGVPQEARQKYDLGSFKQLLWGGNAVDPEIQMKFREIFHCDTNQTYGMAEGLMNWTRLSDPLEIKIQTQGRPISEADDVKIVDPNTEKEVPVGQVGELLCRGPYTIRGYYKAPERNKEVFTAEGYYRTGDLVRKDESGNYIVAGRLKDCISRGVEKINAEEVESHIQKFPKVKMVAVVGMPDKEMGERVCAFIVPQLGKTFALDELNCFLLEERRVAKFKLPERLEFIDELPVTKVGKFEKKSLREKVSAILKAEGNI